jgi:chitodextrinase
MRSPWSTAVLVNAALLALSSYSDAAPPDRRPPTTPTNLRVTAVGPYSVTLAFNPSTDNSGNFQYVVCCANTNSQTFPGVGSSLVYTAGLDPNRPWTLRMYARDAAGNWSQPSNSVSFTTTGDTTPPAQPVVSVTDVGPTHVALMWSATDNDPTLRYTVRLNGAPVLSATPNTSQIFPLLEPETTYVFSVQARDSGGNNSPLSQDAPATTEAPNPDDVTAPTTPTLWTGYIEGCEVQLFWTESSDDFDPQFAIEYEIYLNGVHVDSSALRFTNRVVYANQNGVNTFAVAAVDSAGNRSPMSNEFSQSFEGCVF